MGRIREMEGLRGLLAVWVVVVHLLPADGIEYAQLGLFKPLFGELIRVQIFCIMSGFVIFMMLSRAEETYTDYINRRLLRLYPIYILAFALSILFSGVAYEALVQADFGGEKNAIRIALLDESFKDWPRHVAAHLSLLHGIIPDSWLPAGAYAFLGQGWNISTEFQFYLLAPLLFRLLHLRSLIARMASVLLIIGIWRIFKDWPNDAGLVQFALYFSAGIVSFHLWKRTWANRAAFNPSSITAVAIGVCFFDLAIGGWIFVFGSALIVRDQQRMPGLLAIVLQAPFMLWLGSISYALYLLHMIPLYIAMYFLNDRGLAQAEYAFSLAVCTFGAAIPLSFFAHKYIELYFYKPKTRVRPESSGVAPPHENTAPKEKMAPREKMAGT